MLKLVYQAASQPEAASVQNAANNSAQMSEELTIRGREFSAILSLHGKFTEMGLFRDYGVLGMSDGSNGSIGAIVFRENADETPLARISKQLRGGEAVWVCEIRDREDIYSKLQEVAIAKSQLVFLEEVTELFTALHAAEPTAQQPSASTCQPSCASPHLSVIK